MSKLHWMPLMISDLRGSNTWQGMTLAERGCFIDLLCIAWSNATSNAVCNASCTVPADVDALRRLVPCFSYEDCEALDAVIAKCFKPWPDDPSRLYSPKQLKVWEKQVESYGKRKGAAEKMWAKKRSNASCNAECIADASGSDSDSGSSSDPSTEGTSKETVSHPPDLPKHFDPARHCITTGRYALRKYQFVYIHQNELDDARSQYERAGLSREDFHDALKLANAQLERKQQARDLTEGMAYAYIVGHLLQNAIKKAKERERLGQAKNGHVNGRQRPKTTREINEERWNEYEKELNGQSTDSDTIDANFTVVE